MSLIGTFAVMYLSGFSLNNLTMMALTISTGFVVDDAIVMIENISRYLEEGDKPLEAALKGSGQIGFTIVSLTISLIAVLIPLLFMGDVVGRLFREFAVTLAVTIVISAVVSLTLTCRCCARKSSGITNPKTKDRFSALDRPQVRADHRALRALAELGARPPVRHAARRGRDAGADDDPVHRHPEGLLPDAGHRRDPGHLRSAAGDLVRGDGGAPAGARRR